MPKSPCSRPAPDQQKADQRTQFVQVAREAECDGAPAAWNRRFRAIVKAPATASRPKRKLPARKKSARQP
jgi:hypothetical protein